MESKTVQTFDAPEGLDFRRMMFLVQRWAWLLVVAAVVGAAAAYIASRLQTPVYEATTNILVTRNSQQLVGDITQSLNLTQLVETYVRMLSLDEFLGIVSERLGYPVLKDNVRVSALTNTQVIQLKVQDTDPARAAQIADTMVAVLIERNETLQAGRYAEAEHSLELQIDEVESKIAGVQTLLDQAKDNVLVEQIAQAQSNIDDTVDSIEVVTAQLERLDEMSWEGARFLLSSTKSNLVAHQDLLDEYIARREELESKLATEPLVQTDQVYAAALQTELNLVNTKITDRQNQIEATQKEIEFLTPLITKEGFDATVIEKKSLLQTQRSLLVSYQNVYTSLLSTEEVMRSTNEIDNLEQNLGLYQQIYLDLLSNLEDVKNQKMQNMPTVEQVSPSFAGQYPVKPRTLFNTLLGGLLGLLLVGGVIAFREMTDDTIKDREEVEQLLGTQVIGYIVNIEENTNEQGVYVAANPRSPVAEAFRSLRTNLGFSGNGKPIKSILVTSGSPSEGKSTVASNLAVSLAHTGKKVLLVDCDLRRPKIHQFTGIANQVGLNDLVNEQNGKSASNFIQHLANVPNLGILPSGGLPQNPTELLGSEKMRHLMLTLMNSNDYIVIDSPPLLVADPQVLSGMVDGVLLVMVPGKTRADVVRALKEQIQNSGAHLLGVVFNRLQRGGRSHYTGYSYYYHPYYYSSDYYYSDDGRKVKGRHKKLKRVIDLPTADEQKTKE